AGARRLARRRMAADRERAPRPVLRPDPRRPETARGRDGRLEPPRRRHRQAAEGRRLMRRLRWRAIVRGLRALVDPRGADRDADDEIRHFLDEAAAELASRGRAPHEPRRAARAQWGHEIAVRVAVRSSAWEHGDATL